MGSSASSGPAALIERSHAGAPPSCKICLKNARTRPASPSATFRLRFLAQRLTIGFLRCRREGQLPAQPTAAGSARRKPWASCRDGHLGGTQGRDRAPCVVGPLPAGRRLPCAQGCRDAGMQGCSRLGAQGQPRTRGAAGSGHRLPPLFFGASCVLCSNNHQSILAGEARCFQRV